MAVEPIQAMQVPLSTDDTEGWGHLAGWLFMVHGCDTAEVGEAGTIVFEDGTVARPGDWIVRDPDGTFRAAALTTIDFAHSICRQIAADSPSGYDHWYIDVSVDLSDDEIAYLRSLAGEDPA